MNADNSTVKASKAASEPMPSKPKWMIWKTIFPYLLVFPIVFWILVTIFIPLISVVRESFYDTGFAGSAGEFIGLTNYINVLTSSAFWSSSGRSLIWVLGNGLLQTVLAFSIALLLNNNRKISNIARTWMVIPWIVPTIVVAIFWQWIFNGSYGILNAILINTGLIDSSINFLGNPSLTLPIIIFINSWNWFPFLAVVLLAALANIPEELYEASAVDGANRIQTFRFITIPSIAPVTFAIGLVGTLWMFNIFDLIWVLTEGGPAGYSTTLPVQIYQTAFRQYAVGSASAMSVITALILVIFATLFIKFAAPKE
ncbi:carbohydrate ABC transporter permease [Alkalicoccus daliensis]|uniref:Multiple sugar transport system permease protein n=1 Tax=Alkalicoccus daliensis TaxID=745820 RepID=A0A1H0GEB1_9BACI|nr:sugar ABC transporter permease [Alkalicoccus daliensis]SDO05131.1 multiple sugar transport system permease protein [Alkalicoccus daliensis]